ncbi:MAG: hypothetical protein JJT89_13760 [Nitriliruptoraceae bacterium]|nr:hypothetical protein [Nitriliruptoraceae bacterium]
MHALVVYESMFGHTRQIATSVAEGLARTMSVELAEVSRAPSVVGDDVGFLVVGAPTHALSLPRAATRADAAGLTDEPLVSPGVGLREWLEQVAVPTGLPVACFDTHVQLRIPGSAARAAARRLRARGCRLVAPSSSFHVSSKTGPLLPDEQERARDWGAGLAVGLSAVGS